MTDQHYIGRVADGLVMRQALAKASESVMNTYRTLLDSRLEALGSEVARLQDQAKRLMRERDQRYPNPLGVNFGHGRLLLSPFCAAASDFGVRIRIAEDGPHRVGDRIPGDGADLVPPQPGEIYLSFANEESLRVLECALKEALALREFELGKRSE